MTNEPLSISDLRTELNLSCEEFAARIGLTSRSRVSEIERGAPVSLDVAIAIEALSIVDGAPRIDAASLNPQVAKARAACGKCVDHGAADSADDPAAAAGKSDDITAHKEGIAA